MKKILFVLLAIIALFTLTACGNKNGEESLNGKNQESQKEEKKKNEEEYIDDDNNNYKDEKVVVEKVINCDGCVYAYFSEEKYFGSTLSKDEYTTDVTTLKTKGGKQRHNFFGFILSDNKISRAYSCILKDNKVYCIEGSVDGKYHDSNIGILNQIFTADQCKYISNGHTYVCTDGSYNGDTITTGYASLHYETSCTIYGSDSNTGKMICS